MTHQGSRKIQSIEIHPHNLCFSPPKEKSYFIIMLYTYYYAKPTNMAYFFPHKPFENILCAHFLNKLVAKNCVHTFF